MTFDWFFINFICFRTSWKNWVTLNLKFAAVEFASGWKCERLKVWAVESVSSWKCERLKLQWLKWRRTKWHVTLLQIADWLTIGTQKSSFGSLNYSAIFVWTRWTVFLSILETILLPLFKKAFSVSTKNISDRLWFVLKHSLCWPRKPF